MILKKWELISFHEVLIYSIIKVYLDIIQTQGNILKKKNVIVIILLKKKISKEDKIKIYLSYFNWRNDIYAERYYKNENYYMKNARKNAINFSKQNQFPYF